MKSNLFLALAFLLLIACSSEDDEVPCETTPCPENEQGSPVLLRQVSEQFFPLTGVEQVVFLSEGGLSTTYNSTSGRQESNNPLSFTTCQEVCSSSLISYDSELINLNYTAGQNTIKYFFRTSIAGEQADGDPAFVDVLEISISGSETGSSSMKIITSYRDNAETDIDDSLLNSFTELKDEFTIAGKSFNNVYIGVSGSNELYFNRSVGVIGYKNGSSGETWRFERIE